MNLQTAISEFFASEGGSSKYEGALLVKIDFENPSRPDEFLLFHKLIRSTSPRTEILFMSQIDLRICRYVFNASLQELGFLKRAKVTDIKIRKRVRVPPMVEISVKDRRA